MASTSATTTGCLPTAAGPITFQGKHGEIVGFDDAYLIALVDGYDQLVRLHPTWEIEYIED